MQLTIVEGTGKEISSLVLELQGRSATQNVEFPDISRLAKYLSSDLDAMRSRVQCRQNRYDLNEHTNNEKLAMKAKVVIDTSEIDSATEKVERLNELLREARALENELASREITLTVKVES